MANYYGQQKTKEINLNKLANFERDFGSIERFVQETVNKLTFAMTIPQLLDNDYELIKNHTKKEELEMLHQVFKKYIPQEKLLLRKKTSHRTALAKLSVKQIGKYYDTYSVKSENIPQRDEYDISYALNLLYNNQEIRNISETHKQSISEAAFNFLQDMKLFLYSVMDKMKQSPQQAEAREAFLRNMCNCHDSKSNEVHILEEKILEEVSATEKLLLLKFNKLTALREKSKEVLTDFHVFMKKSSSDTEEQMIHDLKESEYRQGELDKRTQKKLIDINLLRKKFVKEEKIIRIRRLKKQQRVKQLLAQYDRNMEIKQNELDNINKEVSIEKKRMQQLMSYLDEQEDLYKLLKEEEEKNEIQLCESHIRDLRFAIAAGKIQRHFRRFQHLLTIARRKHIMKNVRRRQKHFPHHN